jgi:hypothetical protein
MLIRIAGCFINFDNVTYVRIDPPHLPESIKSENPDTYVEITFASPAVAPVEGTTSDTLHLLDEDAEEVISYLKDYSESIRTS